MPFAAIYREFVNCTGFFPLSNLSKLPWTAFVVFAFETFLTASVSANQSETPPIEYYASSECPTRSEFITEVGEHAQGAMQPPNLDLPPYVVEIGQNENSAFAIFQYRDDSGNQVVRTFKADSCREVASAVALVIALALQGGKAHESESNAIQQKESDSDESSDEGQKPTDGGETSTDDRLDRSREKETGGIDWQVGASLVVDSLTIPGLLIKGGIFGGITWDESGSGIQAGFLYGDSGTIERSERRASFLLLGGRIDVCPLHILHISGVAVHPCLAAEMGSVQSSGEETEGFQSEAHEKFWSAGGPVLRIRVAIYDFRVDIHGGAWFPLFRGTEEYVFSELDGQRTYYDIPTLGGTFGANVGYQL